MNSWGEGPKILGSMQAWSLLVTCWFCGRVCGGSMDTCTCLGWIGSLGAATVWQASYQATADFVAKLKTPGTRQSASSIARCHCGATSCIFAAVWIASFQRGSCTRSSSNILSGRLFTVGSRLIQASWMEFRRSSSYHANQAHTFVSWVSATKRVLCSLALSVELKWW